MLTATDLGVTSATPLTRVASALGARAARRAQSPSWGGAEEPWG